MWLDRIECGPLTGCPENTIDTSKSEQIHRARAGPRRPLSPCLLISRTPKERDANRARALFGQWITCPRIVARIPRTRSLEAAAARAHAPVAAAAASEQPRAAPDESPIVIANACVEASPRARAVAHAEDDSSREGARTLTQRRVVLSLLRDTSRDDSSTRGLA